MAKVYEDVGELVVLRCWCGIQHAIPQSLRNEQLRQHDEGKSMGVYCPLGHSYVPSGESKAEKLRKQLAAERARHDQDRADLRDRIQREKHHSRALKAAKTRLKNRIAKGVCPCCNRSFQNLHRHMQNQHPEFLNETEG